MFIAVDPTHKKVLFKSDEKDTLDQYSTSQVRRYAAAAEVLIVALNDSDKSLCRKFP